MKSSLLATLPKPEPTANWDHPRLEKHSLSNDPLILCSIDERILVGIIINKDVPTAVCIIID